MALQHPLKLAGNQGSPYSVKMRAVLRYRHIPYIWILRGSKEDDLPPVPVQLIPAIAFPNEAGEYIEAMVDSSPLIMRIEGLQQGRSVVPTNPVIAFLDYLIEDYGDEWMTKHMYHYRWYYDDAADKAGKLLPLQADLTMNPTQQKRGYEYIVSRQKSRQALVGSTDNNRAPIEDSFKRLLRILDKHLMNTRFLLGSRPGRGDFGVFGQMWQLTWWDPESVRVALDIAPRVVAWTHQLDDQSSLKVDGDKGWMSPNELPDTMNELLCEIGRTYVPFMLANDAAHSIGSEEVVCMIEGNEYRQGTFVYQVKCLKWLREQYTSLSSTDRTAVDTLLAATGCEKLFV